jgi:hypothetical protein
MRKQKGTLAFVPRSCKLNVFVEELPSLALALYSGNGFYDPELYINDVGMLEKHTN